jgi:hypothetical protein
MGGDVSTARERWGVALSRTRTLRFADLRLSCVASLKSEKS